MRSNAIEHARTVQEVLEFLERYRLTPQDLVEIGGEDLRPGSKLRGKAHRVEKCWEMMARLGVKHAEISADEPTPVPRPEKMGSRQRHSEQWQKYEQDQEVIGKDENQYFLNEINDLDGSRRNENPMDGSKSKSPKKGRPLIGGKPMSGAERAQRHRAAQTTILVRTKQ
jgi:hypothetical protein